MKCYNCGGEYKQVKEDKTFSWDIYSNGINKGGKKGITFTVKDLTMLKCEKCSNILFSPTECRKIHKTFKKLTK